MNLLEQLEIYTPFNEQEEKDLKILISLLKSGEELYSRDNEKYHLTASGWVVNPKHDKLLMCYHKIYDSWSWLGGHADGEKDLMKVALKEVREESGIEDVRPLLNQIFSLEILTVDGHEKKGKYVSSHLHLNVTYLLEADDREPLKIKEDENKGVKWFKINEAIGASSEPWFRERIYTKLNKKMENYL